MPIRVSMLVAAAVAVVAISSCREGERRPRPARQGLDGEGRMQLGTEDRCPVCAMDVSAHERFACGIELDDGTAHYFCGTGCLMKSWLHPEAYLGARRAQLKRAVVQEYFGGKTIDAQRAIFVAGSDVVGPMGKALVPLATDEDVKTFRQRHGGKAAFRLDELDDALFQKLTGKAVLRSEKAPR